MSSVSLEAVLIWSSEVKKKKKKKDSSLAVAQGTFSLPRELAKLVSTAG